nr:MAG TPA: hypothetical protein [Bacteriophage sp.]
MRAALVSGSVPRQPEERHEGWPSLREREHEVWQGELEHRFPAICL